MSPEPKGKLHRLNNVDDGKLPRRGLRRFSLRTRNGFAEIRDAVVEQIEFVVSAQRIRLLMSASVS